MQGVYQIRNKVNGKRYVGSSQDIRRRKIEHIKALTEGAHYNSYLQRAWNKYGEKNFEFEVIEEVLGNKEVQLDREQGYLDKGFEEDILYNTSRSAWCPPSRKGKHHTEKTKAKMSKAKKGKGCPHTEETKRKIGNANKGKIRTEEHKAVLSKIRKEQIKRYGNPFKGMHHTKETKAKISKANSGKNNYMYGKHHSEETRAKISQAVLGTTCPMYRKRHSKEAIAKKAKPYPAFYNEITKEFIPAGRNLKDMCEKSKLSHDSMFYVKSTPGSRSRSGWRLATIDEIEEKRNESLPILFSQG